MIECTSSYEYVCVCRCVCVCLCVRILCASNVNTQKAGWGRGRSGGFSVITPELSCGARGRETECLFG